VTLKKILFTLFLLFFLVLSIFKVGAADYNPVITAKLESGDRLYTDFIEEDEFEEINDKYYYNKFWLNYKQKISSSDYYYFKFQYYNKDYLLSDTYNNTTLDFWTNYTYMLNDKTRNRYKLNIKDKDYYSNEDSSYSSYRLDYELDYDYDEKNDYSLGLQRQWNKYKVLEIKDSIRDKIKLEWDYEYSDDFSIKTTFQYEQEVHDSFSTTTNKYGKQLSLSFKYDL